ncbi:DNA-directed RNA polymerase I kDa polypeptide [Lentinula edodes]|uniref:DNA-directed RNA polymerase subunit n=3 Tax=Lentinula TaxID=5352 RepID=A0A1Q3E6D8_LENED|nr:DNA-directed RNA polymerase I kDa polypeptide [Lentinula edodes]KAJ3935717.1 MAG: DNA-directed RNA polymerase I kDa polypeptide [Lentinula lateritia]KAH7881456.1 DNA-directed RNA polymerase I kDa polypeptide [Lentinula edodes]KAJ3880909.1 DNA-directed RNA polymerase I kDa polypeptide [Lentinula edodes]KAJ3901650.1 DNA-directed RNA polymerase I kDa polypeptide [Lentinula edodes]KAJ4477878.1 DNA-directed RNA polymerase I kDa polypeptide [Lentinula edodes]
MATKIGSLLFCPTCGTLLDLPKDSEPNVLCEQCGHQEPATSYENIKITTRSHPDAFPSALRQKRKTQTKTHDSDNLGDLVSEKCPACNHPEAYSKALQLRSADEGSTVFYTCASCKHGWRVNN